MSEYHRLDFDKLYFAETPVSYGDAVKDAVPFDVSKGVMSRKRELKILSLIHIFLTDEFDTLEPDKTEFYGDMVRITAYDSHYDMYDSCLLYTSVRSISIRY